jgi:HSP20 family protein
MTVPAPRMSTPIHRMRPFRELEEFYDRMGELLESAFGRETTGWTPAADFSETADAYLVEAELPGVPQEDIDVEVVGNELTITGEIKERKFTGTPRHRTRRTGRFEYRATLPHDVDPNKIEANLSDGVLTVRVPISEKAKPRKVKITHG